VRHGIVCRWGKEVREERERKSKVDTKGSKKYLYCKM
jgi:hypothetical protein